MATMSIPSSGIALTHLVGTKDKDGDGQLPILRLDLIESKTKDILHTLRSKQKVSLQAGKQTAIRYGDKKLLLQTSPEAFPTELYVRSRDDGEKLFFSGKFSHALEIQKAREATTKADEALAQLESTLKAMKEERAQNEITIFHSKDDMKLLNKKGHKPSPSLGSAFRRDHLMDGVTKSMPSSPYLGAAPSPQPGPTSAPLNDAGFDGSSKAKLRLDAIKIPLTHLLAGRPMSSKAIADKIRAPRDDVDRLLLKYAKDSERNLGKKELKEKTYKELDVWKFPYQSEDDRKAAIERAIHAFDRMRVEKTDPIWQMLLPATERGKGKILSRLNMNKAVPSTTLLKPERADSKGEVSDREGSKSPNVKAKRTTEQHREIKRTTSKARGHPASPLPGKKRNISQARDAKQDDKFKSAERIVDSDEEADNTDVMPAKPKTVKKHPQSTVSLHSPHKRDMSPKKQLKKSALSHSSSSSDSSDNRKLNKSLNPPARDQLSKHSPRPRHGSSPQKPSPLGSSPPANSTDFDSSSSSKQSQSSAPSSPPSSTDIPIATQKQKYSPIISENAREVSRGRAPVKRKPDEMENIPPAKRHQVNGVHTEKLSKGVKEERPSVERKMTDSDQSSASEKGPPPREDVINEAKRFQLYYKKYKELHEKLATKPQKERDQRDIDNLMSMHERLKEMKAGIWGNWDKVEKTASTKEILER